MNIPETCAICLEDTTYVKLYKRVVKPNGGVDCCKLKCGHVFHRKCIKKWYAVCHDSGCPCCRQRVQFRGVSFLYNVVILEYAYYEKESLYYEWEYDDIRYIYHDNPGTILFVNDIISCRIHFCFWSLLNSLKKKYRLSV